MRIAHKLFLGCFVLALMIWAVGLYAVAVGHEALRESIEATSAHLATKIMDEVDRAISAAIDDWRVYTSDPLLQQTLAESNRRFGEFPDVQAYVEQQDLEWRAAPKETVTPFMRALIDNELSEDVRRRLDALERIRGYKVFGEVFLTNRYGANVAQSGKTSDYRQDDEDWWQQARVEGTHVCDVQYDSSAGVYSTDICLRINDANSGFAGVLKGVLDIQGIIRILKSRAAGWGWSSEAHRSLRLLTADRKVIFSSDEPFAGLRDGTKLLDGVQLPGRGHVRALQRHDEKLGDLLTVCARSRGHHDFKGLGWVLVLEHRADDVFAPVTRLRNHILVTAAGVTLIGLTLAMSISASISRRLNRLRDEAGEIGSGHLDARTEDRSSDEIGQLSARFNDMAGHLQETVVSRSYMENILASMVDTLIIISPDGVIQRANPATCRLLGFDEQELCGEPITKILAGDDPFGETGIDALLDKGSVPNVDTTYRTKSGREIPVSFSASVIRDGRGKVQGVVCVAADITRRKETEAELARSNEELERFAYVASHDLQEPLRMVSSYVQLLARRYQGKLDADADEFIHFAVDGARRMGILINDLLTYSRVRTRGKQPQPTDVMDVLNAVLHDLKGAIQDADATVTHDELPEVMADPVQLGQLLQNLVGNAIKYRRDKSPCVHISATENGEMWRFAVRDNGIGIEPQYLDRIFVIFQRLHGREVYPGTGIGLAVCRKIVERHGGSIWAESEPGEGSTFYFTLPKKESKRHD